MEDQKIIGRIIGGATGIMMSFFLSLYGTISSGHFTIVGFLVSFLFSSVVSIIIGIFVPMKKINDTAVTKANLTPGSIGARCLESFIGDCIFTPIMTTLMVFMAYKRAAKFSPEPIHFAPLLVRQLIACFIIGFVLLLIFSPLIQKVVIKTYMEGEEGIDEK